MKYEYKRRRVRFKPGDIIHSYYKGIWIVTAVVKRKDAADLVEMRKVATEHGQPCKPVTSQCDVGWCRLALKTTLDYMTAQGVVIPLAV
jgi:hypothetical protein